MYRPFILDPLHPAQAAVRGDNVLDNVEQDRDRCSGKGFLRDSGLLTKENYKLIVSLFPLLYPD